MPTKKDTTACKPSCVQWNVYLYVFYHINNKKETTKNSEIINLEKTPVKLATKMFLGCLG